MGRAPLGTWSLRSTTTTRTTTTLRRSRATLITKNEKYVSMVSIEEVCSAYRDCRKNKRNSLSALEYELDYELNNYELWRQLNDKTYAIGTSVAFCVTYPKLREVFAASFRDRIVHHLIINKFMPIIEGEMIDSSYNCRKGKGVLYGIRDMQSKIQRVTHYGARQAYCLKCDIKGFFMSIDKDIMYRIIENVIRERYDGEDIEWWLWLINMVVYHRPEQNCEWHGDPSLRNGLEPGKSLMTSNGRGLPIGNYTSQIFANLYMTIFDRWITQQLSVDDEYGRFVDDFVIMSTDKRKLLSLIGSMKKFLSERLHLTLHPNKICLTKASQGVKFTGYVIRQDRIYCASHTVNRMLRMINEWNNDCNPDVDRYICRYNSYSGFLVHCSSYKIRERAWDALSDHEGLENVNMRHIRRIKK